jgi:hypothetical protein
MSASAAMGAGGLGVGFGRAADGWLDLLIARGLACPECLLPHDVCERCRRFRTFTEHEERCRCD